VPPAPGWTTKQLGDRLSRALQAIDPDLRRRRYQRAVQERGVALYLDPRTGTATLAGNGLPPDEAAAAAQRIDRLVEATKRAGHPGRRAQISADVYLGMLNGSVHGLTENEIINWLLATHRPEDGHDTDTGADHPGAPDQSSDAEAPGDTEPAAPGTETETAAETSTETGTGTETETGAGAATEAEAGAEAGTGAEAAESGTADETDRDTAPGDPAAASAGENTDRWAGDRVATREGIEIRVGLATLAGLDDRPAEIPGLGPVGAHLARDAVSAQRRGASWKFAIVDTDGYLLLAGPLRRRPRRPAQSPPVRGGVVELHLTLDELRRYGADPVLGAWDGVLAEIADAWADRDEFRRRLAANPHARFARGPLADHVRIRDRGCVGPGCTRSARRCDLDHTRDHAHGGETVDDNIGPACKGHHPDKGRGWTLTQPEPGLFRWVSPLGRTYWTRGEPIRPDLPEPDPAPHPDEETASEVDQRLRRHDPPILERPANDPPRPTPPEPEPPPDDDPPF
jgi:hypothetical protein